MARPAIGIDLGTTNSVIALFDGTGVRILPNRLGGLMTPSVVALDPDGDGLLTGRPAKEILALAPERAAATFKRGIGGDREYKLNESAYNAVELSACVLRSLREDASAALGTEVEACVVTVPAYFNEEQRFATIKAAELAGLEVLRVLNEPTAAAMAYGIHERDRDAEILVFDLGGGTFDVCVMELFEGTLQVRSTAGESNLGGEDFTRRLVSVVLHEVGLSFERAEMVDPAALGLLAKRCELAKRKLSESEQVDIVVPPFEGLLDRPVPIPISRDEAEEAWKPLLRRLLAPTKAALRAARLTKPLDEVILVGGATRMPCVRAFVQEHFERAPAESVDADLAVAHGAAIQAALSLRDAAVEDIVVTDVLSHSLGVEVVQEVAGRIVPGYFSPVIHRNTVIPTVRTDMFSTIHANQTVLDLEVYEGESRRVEENRHMGSLRVKGIPKGPAGQGVEVSFTYDVNGILEVEARVAGTDKFVRKIFTRDSRTLSEDALKRAAARIRKLKDDPLKKIEYRDLMLRAELLWKDLPPEGRSMLAGAIGDFESAIAGRNPDELRTAYATLFEVCEQIDGGDRW